MPVVLAGAVLYAAGAALSRPLTGVAAAAVAAPAAVVLVLTLRARAGRTADCVRIRRTALAWGALALVAAGWELAAWLQQPAYNVVSPDRPTLSALLDPLTGSGPARFAAWCCWLFAGWRLVRR